MSENSIGLLDGRIFRPFLHKGVEYVKILKSENGQSMVEFAFAFIFLLFFLMGIFEFSWLMGNKLLATNASREGARYLAVHHEESTWKNDTINFTSKAMAINTSSSLIKNFKVNPDKNKQVVTSGDGVSVTVSYTVNPLTGFIPVSIIPKDFPITASTTMKKE